ncbi:MAG: SusC/RagA family TonB-linked outer membrane protein [Chitinophagaceae bacterium]
MFLTALRKNKEESTALLTKTWMIMKLSIILLLVGSMHVCASGLAQNVSMEGKNTTLEKVFAQFRKQTGLNFFYTSDDVDRIGKIDVALNNVPLRDALTSLLKDTPLSFNIVDGVVVIKKRTEPVGAQAEKPPVVLTGKVLNEKGEPIQGASVVVVGTRNGTTTNSAGVFTLRVDNTPVSLSITSVGYKRKFLENVTGTNALNIVLETETEKLEDVVVSNGMFNRKMGSFTGAVATFTGEELKTVSNQNVLKSLAILDPSFQVMDNLDLGSDPNRLPEIQLRGQTGFPDLQGTYTTNPNQPLFILDGFETTLEKVNDLNLNLIKSVTILKDASAKAIWGSRAGNGVVVIETKVPTAGKLRVSYNGSADVSAPDLSSYELTNAMQKVEAEVLAGVYSSANPAVQAELLRSYSTNLKAALEGVNTYWLSQPLRNGVGQRHAINLDGGDDAMRYSVNVNYNNVAGVMKGSDRNTLSGMVNLIYRTGNFQFRNSLTVDRNRSDNSPYGSYGNISRLNPYWRMTDDNGNLVKTFPNGVGNPMYDGSLNIKDFSTYTNIIENFYADWDPLRNLRFTARVGLNAQNNSAEQFIPASHSRYANIPVNSEEYLDRGQYTISNGKQNNINADLLANYSIRLNKHHFFLNGGYSLTQNRTQSNGMTMVGFPNDKMDDISFGRRYAPGTKAAGTENTSRSIALTSAVNYSFDDRLLVDLSMRGNASSQFGADNRWGAFWSAGIGWNAHREKFMRNVKAVDQLRFRASTGTTGTQNFNSYQSLTTYVYNTAETYNGDLGMLLAALPNPALQWQQVQDNNIGFDIGLFGKVTVRFDYYIRDTKNLLTDMIVAPSAGFSTYKENIGSSRNDGFQASASVRVYQQTSSRTSVNLFANVAANRNRIREVSNSLQQLNAEQDALKDDLGTDDAVLQRPSTRFQPGQSMSAIWAVPSLGIDPANGREIYVKRDGSLTYDWSAADQVVSGDENPLVNGTFGANVQHKGFSGNLAFTFRTGGQLYNSTLVTRVENADFNYNVDLRAFEERWRKPGDVVLYKNIADLTPTRPTSRFVQDLHELLFSSISLGYDFSTSRWLKNAKVNRVYLAFNLNDLGRISSVRTERGLDYPYARTISTSLNITF